MTEWRKVKLGDICSIKSGKRLPKGADFSLYPTDYKYIRARDIKNGSINDENLAYISQDVQERIAKYIVNTNDVVVTIVGASVGDVAFVSPKFDGINLTENAVRLTDFDEHINPQYIFYLLNTKEFFDLMQRVAGGAAQPKLGIYKIEAITVEVPSISIQNHIVRVLSRYDALIENYQRQIKLLEEAAQRLYKEWFVDLRFPGHQSTPIINNLPQSWQKKKLGEIADIIMGQSPKSEYYNKEHQGLPFHQGVGSYGNRFVIDEVYSTSLTRVAEPNSVLFSVRAPVGRLNITKNRIVIGRGIAAINHKQGYQSYLFYLLKERFFKDNMIGNGSIFASISKDELHNLSFLVPSEHLIKRFDDITSKYDKSIMFLDNQIRNLSEARDRLLPKLMSGEIEV